MKKLIPMLLAMLLPLSGCQSNEPVSREQPLLQPRPFSQETQEILDLIGDTYFYDFELDDSLRSYSIDYWTTTDGEWTRQALAMDDFSQLNHSGLGLQVLSDSVILYDFNENGTAKIASPYSLYLENESDGVMCYHLDSAEVIEPGKDIILYQRITALPGEGIETGQTGHFDADRYSAGTALTITFYDHPLEN